MIKNIKADKRKALDIRLQYRGLLGVAGKMPVRDKLGLSLVYTPGVAEPCRAIMEDSSQVYTFTSKGRSVALVSNGSAFLDMGDIGPAAMLPVLEGEAAVLAEMAHINAYPVCVNSKSAEDVAFVLRNIAPTFGAMAVLGTNRDEFDEMQETLELDIPVVRYEDILDGVFARRSGMSERDRFISSHMVMPGFLRAVLAARPEKLSTLSYYAAAKEMEETFKIRGAGAGEGGVLDSTLVYRTAAACADAFVASGDARNAINTELFALQIRQSIYEGRLSIIPAAEMPWREGDIDRCSLDLYRRYSGSIRTRCKIPLLDKYSVALVAAPGSLYAAEAVAENADRLKDCTFRANSVAVVTDGSAVLGMGNIGSSAGMPVMEGKCVLFKAFAGLDAIPLCLETQKAAEIVKTLTLIGGTYGGINLEDIAAPKCFEVERKVKEAVDVCVFHDDQHGTATVVLAGLLNALKLTSRTKEDCSIVMNGAGAAGLSVARMLLEYGFNDVTLCDTNGAIYDGRKEGMNDEKRGMALKTNRSGLKGNLADVMKGKNVFIGVSTGGCVSGEMVKSMADDPIIFALANPIPEIMPDDAREAGARVIATGRSDLPNQVNNALIFPAIFRSALDCGVPEISGEMKIAAAETLAACIPEPELTEKRFIPGVLDVKIHSRIAAAAALAAIQAGQATRAVEPADVMRGTNAAAFEQLEHAFAVPRQEKP